MSQQPKTMRKPKTESKPVIRDLKAMKDPKGGGAEIPITKPIDKPTSKL